MKRLTRIFACAAVAGMLATVAQAVPINGSISFSGAATLNPASVFTSTSVDFGAGPYNAIVIAASGDYSTVPAGVIGGQLALFNDFTFSSFSSPVPNLWSFTYNGWTYSMTADTLTEVDRNTAVAPPVLNLKGTGVATITGTGSQYDATAGIWNISVTQAGTSFSFASAAVVSGVPDGGTTIILLGSAMCGLAVLRRKLFA